MEFLNIGPMELILIMVIALLVLGPERLPEIGAGLGKAIREFRQMSQGLTGEINKELQQASAPVRDLQKDVKKALDPLSIPPVETTKESENETASESKINEEKQPAHEQSDDPIEQ